MKYGRFDVDGVPRWGVLRDNAVEVLDGAPFGEHRVVAECEPSDARALAPVTPSKIFCLGRNYAAHRAEMGYAHDGSPSVFMKPLTTIIGNGDDIVLPPTSLSDHVEHEAELAVVIGRTARAVSAADALDHVFGYTCANDVSARDLQRSDPHPTRGKGFDTFCPIGPWIDTDVDPIGGIELRCSVNGELRQRASTAEMTYGIPFLIEYLSGFATLLPGDVVLTGSPGGSAAIRDGDAVVVDIEGIGALRNGVSASVSP